MTVVDLYTIQIVTDDVVSHAMNSNEMAWRVNLVLGEAEENLTDLLPAGYRARIRRWDHPDPDERNDNE